MCIPCDKTFPVVPWFLARTDRFVSGAFVIAEASVSALDVYKNFNLGHNFQTIWDAAFIFHMSIPCDKTFHMLP